MNRLEFTSDTHGCRVEPLEVHIRRPRMPTQTAWSSHPTTTYAELDRLGYISTHSTAIHGRMLHVSLDHDGGVMVLIAEAAKEKYDG